MFGESPSEAYCAWCNTKKPVPEMLPFMQDDGHVDLCCSERCRRKLGYESESLLWTSAAEEAGLDLW